MNRTHGFIPGINLASLIGGGLSAAGFQVQNESRGLTWQFEIQHNTDHYTTRAWLAAQVKPAAGWTKCELKN